MDLRYGSDIVVQTLVDQGIDFVAGNPGASWRGLHASLVASGRPELIMTLQENVAVAIGHGYAKATGRPMAVALHNLVGLQAGSMAIFNAWIDHAPVLVLGGSGPADHMQRRPWIDWIHSARPQVQPVREFVKWDDEPVSTSGIPSSLLRALRIAETEPKGPTYVALDALLQEAPIQSEVAIPSYAHRPTGLSAPEADLERIVDALVVAERPVVVADSLGRSEEAYDALQRLVAVLRAPVVDLGGRHNFPARHPLDQSLRLSDVVADADLVLALDCRDLQWVLSETDHEHHTLLPRVRQTATVMGLSVNELTHRGFLSREALPPADFMVTADSRHALPELARLVEKRRLDTSGRAAWLESHAEAHASRVAELARRNVDGGPLSLGDVVTATWEAVRGGPWLLAYAGAAPGRTHAHVRAVWEMDAWNCFLGPNGGGGLGYGLGAATGAALAHRDDDVLVVSLQADGDAMYTPQALWTAAHHRLPLLVVLLNNRSYGQDRMHQAIVTRMRDGDLRTVPVGIDIDQPAVDFVQLARSQGVEAFGPIEDASRLSVMLRRGAGIVRDEGRPVLVEVVLPRPGFGPDGRADTHSATGG